MVGGVEAWEQPGLFPVQTQWALDCFRCPSYDVSSRMAALNHPAVSNAEVFMVLGESRELRRLALSATDRADVLELLADSPRVDDRAIIAFNPSTPGTVLARLAEDTNPEVRANAGLNGNLPLRVRVSLALHDPEPAVRDKVIWAMTSVRGRALLEGQRFLPGRYATSDDSGEAIHVARLHL